MQRHEYLACSITMLSSAKALYVIPLRVEIGQPQVLLFSLTYLGKHLICNYNIRNNCD
jgi:hypothetical protein